MRSTLRHHAYLYPLALIVSASPAIAQDAAGPEEIELPPVVVVQTPSPVVKKKKKKTAPASAVSAPPVPVDALQESETVSTIDETPPGTMLVVTDAYAPVTVVTSREIAAQQGATITDTIMNKPGITGSTFAPAANRPIIRGLDSYRVRIQENGIGSHDVSTISEDHAVPIDPFSVENIEVVRGPASLRFGSGAIGGVVAVHNNRIPTVVPPGGFSGEIKGGFSSVDRGRDGAIKATAGVDGVVVHADGFKRASGDYSTPNGRQRNSFAESDGFGTGVSLVGPDGFVGVSVAHIDSLYGVPGEEADEGVDPRIDMNQQKILARGEWRPRAMGVDAIRFWFGASEYEHAELARHEGEGFEVESLFSNDEQEGRLEIQRSPVFSSLGELTGAVGIQIGHRETRGQSFEGESLLEPARTNSIAAFWFEDLKVSEQLSYQAALRVENTNVDGFGWSDVSDPNAPVVFDGDRTFIPVSASLGVLVEPVQNITARLTGQYAERAPDAAELFSKGIHEATGTFEIGNPNLEKEKAFSFEAGLARAKGPFRFDATAFYTYYKGFIYRDLQDVRCLEDLPSCGPAADLEEENFDQVLFRQRDARFYGVELAGQYDIAPIWRGVWGIDGRYDFVRARFEGDENVPRIPPHRLGGGLYYRDDNWFARAGVLHAFDQDRVGINEVETPGYTLVSAELSYTGEVADGTVMTIGVKGENLADDEVLNHASFKRREDVLLPGASVRVFGSMKLN